MKYGLLFSILISALILVGSIWLLFDNGDPNAKKLQVYCAAGMRLPFAEIIREYKKEYGVEIETTYDGSGTLQGMINAQNRGDLFLAADRLYLEEMQSGVKSENIQVAEILPIAYQHPVIAVYQGNPKNIKSLDDLLREDVKLTLADPKLAAISRVARKHLKVRPGLWKKLWQKKFSSTTTVNEVAGAVASLNAADATIVWDATVTQIDTLEAISVPEFAANKNEIAIGVLSTAKDPGSALHFARYVSAHDRGLKYFKSQQYQVIQGDSWANKPEILFYSGGLNWIAAQEIVKQFSDREQCLVLENYAGCGQLVGEINDLGERPDTYFACDTTYIDSVQQYFDHPENVCRAEIVIVTPKENKKQIAQLSDLAKPGLKLGMCNPKLSALGDLSLQLLNRNHLAEAVQANVINSPGTAAVLVEGVETGALDAAIVYLPNAYNAKNDIQIIHLNDPTAFATQPVAVGKNSKHKYLAQRLMDKILSAKSREILRDKSFHLLE